MDRRSGSADGFGGPPDRPARGSLAELRLRLERLPAGHPSSPYDDTGARRPAPQQLRQLELPLADEEREAEPPARASLLAATAGDRGGVTRAQARPVPDGSAAGEARPESSWKTAKNGAGQPASSPWLEDLPGAGAEPFDGSPRGGDRAAGKGIGSYDPSAPYGLGTGGTELPERNGRAARADAPGGDRHDADAGAAGRNGHSGRYPTLGDLAPAPAPGDAPRTAPPVRDNGEGDPGSRSAGNRDARNGDSRNSGNGGQSTGRRDTGVNDAGRTDTGLDDAGRADSGLNDSGLTDTGLTDTGAFNTGAYATGSVATGVPDTGAYATGSFATGTPDTATPDTGSFATATYDTGSRSPAGQVTGSHGEASRHPAYEDAAGLLSAGFGLTEHGLTDHDHGGPDHGPAAPAPGRAPADPSPAARHVGLTREQEQIANRALGRYRAADGRNVFGGYGESGLTPAIRRVEAHLPNGRLAGDSEDYTLKSPERFKEKLARMIARSPGVPAEDLAAEIYDAARYTFVFEPQEYTDGTWLVHRRLKAQGFELEARRNRWESPEYKGIRTRWRDPAHDLAFEVQFHTPASWDVLQRTHDAYLRITDPHTPAEERARLRAGQVAAAAATRPPPRCAEIGDFRADAR